ncbi:ribonuclease H-like domain-containing protein [Rhizophagus irregularis DAOM 181602=DAOM 197198]|nr:ribonuclease H-like domain-containing protein [Rhizophagus irregularis DAOM 181602=DAOM 197198]
MIEPEQNVKSKGGHPQSSVWEHFIKAPLSTAGHFAAECLYCEKKWVRGRPQELQVHLAKDCLNQKQETIDQCLLKVFVCYGTPFAVVENPFFVDLIKKLQPNYKLPSHEKLAGIMLSHAVIRIENQVKSILKRATNLTLGLDGWTNPAVVTDNAANCALARNIISEKYPFIINTRCIAHCVNLITKDILDEHKDIIKENIVKTIISRGFFHDINSVLKVLKPLKKTILSVEASNTTFADCFIALIRLASTINKIPVERGLADF